MIDPVDGDSVLNEIVGADGKEVDFPGNFAGYEGGSVYKVTEEDLKKVTGRPKSEDMV